MAHVDPRLQELFEVMSNAGFDWIVSEVLNGLRQGRIPLATQAELESVRSRVDQQTETRGDPPPEADSEPIIGEDQITFAVNLVRERFKYIKAMLHESEENLRSISAKSDPPRAGPQLAFKVDDHVRPITSHDAEEIAKNIEGLVVKLSGWANSVRSKSSDTQ